MQLKVSDLTVSAQFVRGEQTLLNGVGFCVRSGEPLAIVGESGSGKTMLALALLGLLPENCEATGSAALCYADEEINGERENVPTDGADLSDCATKKLVELIGMKERLKNKMRGREIVYIPQSGGEFLNPALKISTQLYESLKKSDIKGKRLLKSAALQRLAAVGLEDEDILGKYPGRLSGGQAQRVTIAMSLSPYVELVIADEPTKGIDAQTARLFEDGLYKFYPDACVIVITHSLELAAKCKKVLVLKDGEVIEYGDAAEVLGSPKSEYTRRLIEDMPEAEGDEDA